jgi:hypothetical protein
MPSYRKHNPPTSHPPRIDLSEATEANRRRLYDAAVAIHFPDPDEPHDPDDFVPEYSPDDAGLVVFHALGRWWATWLMLEEPSYLPESRRREVLRVIENPEAAYGLTFLES